MTWYPEDKNELSKTVDSFLGIKPYIKGKINGIIVPHAGYDFSGSIAGKAFSILPKKQRAIILGPSHYISFKGIRRLHSNRLETPLGKIKVAEKNYKELNVPEHSLINHVPFLQKLGFTEVIPLIVGDINEREALDIAKDLTKQKDCVFIFSTDLSHFLEYEEAKKIDTKTIEIIKNLEIKSWKEIDACGIFPLLVLINLCKIKKWQPQLIEYKNSGDITGEKKSVVGYASFYF